jgi:hypothetical protein
MTFKTFIKESLLNFLTLFAVIAGIILFLSLFFIIPMIKNNISMMMFESHLRKIDLGSNSKVIDVQKDFGHMYGSGNHCDVKGLALVKTTLNPLDFHKQVKESDYEIVYPFRENQKVKDSFATIFYKKDKEIFLVHKNKVYKIEKAPSEYGSIYFVKDVPYDFMLESRDYKQLQDMFSKVQEEKDVSYFILSFWDQDESMDLRCN